MLTASSRAQSYGPPAKTPNPVVKTSEYATPSWTLMKPPAERPDTETEMGSTLYAPRLAAKTLRPAMAARRLIDFMMYLQRIAERRWSITVQGYLRPSCHELSNDQGVIYGHMRISRRIPARSCLYFASGLSCDSRRTAAPMKETFSIQQVHIPQLKIFGSAAGKLHGMPPFLA